MDATGSDLAGRFDVQETLRTSSVSQSLRARDRGTGTPVTVTALSSTESSNAVVMADVQSAATMLESAPAAGLVRVLEVTTLDGRLVLVTGEAGGATLAELMSGGNRFAPGQVAHFGRAIATGLAGAHAAGVVHGALTPNAVVRGTDGQMRVADFGFARQPIMVADSPTWSAYAAPEQLLDGTVDERSDIYALGSLLYLMVTGHAPFVDFDEELLRARKLSEAAPAPSHDEPMIPPAFDALVARMLARDPMRRPQSAAEVADDLARFEDTVVAAPVAVRTETVVTEVLPRVVPIDDLERSDPLPMPYVVKPVNEGSSVGVEIIKAGDNRRAAVARAWKFGREALVEEYIPGRELTVAVMGERPLAVTEILADAGVFYDYESKYADGGSRHIVPAAVHPRIYAQALDVAAAAHRVLGCRGATRADFRYDDTAGEPGRLVLLEINTQPGLTPTSLLPEQAAYVGMSFPRLCAWMVENAACRV